MQLRGSKTFDSKDIYNMLLSNIHVFLTFCTSKSIMTYLRFSRHTASPFHHPGRSTKGPGERPRQQVLAGGLFEAKLFPATPGGPAD